MRQLRLYAAGWRRRFVGGGGWSAPAPLAPQRAHCRHRPRAARRQRKGKAGAVIGMGGGATVGMGGGAAAGVDGRVHTERKHVPPPSVWLVQRRGWGATRSKNDTAPVCTAGDACKRARALLLRGKEGRRPETGTSGAGVRGGNGNAAGSGAALAKGMPPPIPG